MANSFSKRKWNRVWNNVKYYAPKMFWAVIEFIRLYIIRYAALAVACLFGVCVILPIFLIFICNPVAYLIWALIIPASAASWVVQGDDDGFLDTIMNFLISTVRWEMYLLPWYAKKHFIAKFPNNFKSSTVMKYFRGLKTEKEQMEFLPNVFPVKGSMSVEYTQLMKKIWDMAEKNERKLILSAKSYRNKAFSLEEVKYACENNMHELVQENFELCTPSSEVLKSLIGIYAETDDINCEDWLKVLIKRVGLSSELISFANGLKNEKLDKLVEESLLVFGQKSLAQRYNNNNMLAEWEKFCATTELICTEAQKFMSRGMMAEFHRLGHHLSEEAIFYFLSKKDERAKDILIYESDHGLVSQRIKNLVFSSPELLQTLNGLKYAQAQ